MISYAMRLGVVVLIVFTGISGSLSTAHAEDARVLPKGRSRFAMTYAQTGAITQTFNNDGMPESLTAPYNLDLNSAKMRSVSPELGALISNLNAIPSGYDVLHRNINHGATLDPSAPRLGDALSRGFLNTDAEANRKQYNLQFQYGITERLSLGFMIPYIRTSVNVYHQINGVNTAEDIRQIVMAQNASGDLAKALDQISKLDDNGFQTLLTSKGYSRFDNYDGGGIGDIVLGGRYNYLNARAAGGEWISSFQAGVTAPSGRVRPPSELTQVDFGQGAWDLGAANIVNYSPISWLTLSNGLHYTYRLPSHRIMRVRADTSDVIPDTSDEENVAVNLGDKYWTSLGAKISFSRAFSIDTSYEWFWKRLNKYSGTKNRDYSYLSELTDGYAETIQVGASVNSIPAFMKYEFPVPAELSVNLYVPTRGKNSIIAPYGTAELALFF